MHSSTELDPAALATLRTLNLDGALFARLRMAFERLLERQQANLLAARQSPPDFPALRRAMHVLGTAAESLGARALAQSCRELEAIGRAECPDGLGEALERFEQHLARAQAALSQWQ